MLEWKTGCLRMSLVLVGREEKGLELEDFSRAGKNDF